MASAPGIFTQVVTAGAHARPLWNKLCDVLTVLDYGALGTNSLAAIGTAYGNSLADLAAYTVNGVTPYAWALDPNYGLTFAMQVSVAQPAAGTVLTFLGTVSSGYSATVALWQDPRHGNYRLVPGMLVAGAGIPAGTTLVSVGRDPFAASGYGTVTLSAATSRALNAGTTVSFTVAPAQVQALTVDYLGIQSAIAQANARGGQSAVYLPGGLYNINHDLVNANGGYQGIHFRGDGAGVTRIVATQDLGTDAAMLIEVDRSCSGSEYHDFALFGPNVNTAVDAIPNAMYGLLVGARAAVYRVVAQLFFAGVAWTGDHQTLANANLTNNAYGLYFAPYGQTFGNQLISNVTMAGNTRASVGKCSTNTLDSMLWTGGHTGFGPYGLWSEPAPPTVSNPRGLLTNSRIDAVPMEALGNAWICGLNAFDNVSSNVFMGGGGADVGGGGTVAGDIAVIIANGSFGNNTLVGTMWGERTAAVTHGLIQGPGYNNHVVNDLSLLQNGNGTKSVFVNNIGGNTFDSAAGSGVFMTATANLTAGMPVQDNGNFQAGTYTTGQPFAGITLYNVRAGVCFPLVQRSSSVSVVKANASAQVNSGLFMAPVTRGFQPCGVSDYCVGVSGAQGDPGNTTMQMTLKG